MFDTLVLGINVPVSKPAINIGEHAFTEEDILALQKLLKDVGVLELTSELLKSRMSTHDAQILVGYLGGYE